MPKTKAPIIKRKFDIVKLRTLFLYFFYSVTIVCIFSPSLHPIPASPTSLPTSILPLDFVLVSFIVAPIDPSPHYPLPTPLWISWRALC